MELTQEKESIPQQKPFAPFVSKTEQTRGCLGIGPYNAAYNEKYNMIIACHGDHSLLFYDATTLLPFKGVKREKLYDYVHGISFWAETETFIFGCLGHIYTYNLSSRVLQQVQKVEIQEDERDVGPVVFLNSHHYAYGKLESDKLHVGNLENGDLFHFPLRGGYVQFLEGLTKRNLLLAILRSGSVQIFRTGQISRLPLLDSIPGYETHRACTLKKIQSITINRREYIITIGSDCQIKIWSLTKGKIRRIKVIHTEENVVDLVYLEDYKMLVTTHFTRFAKFWRFPSGKLELTMDLNMKDCSSIILMKDKDSLGFPGIAKNIMKIVKLHP